MKLKISQTIGGAGFLVCLAFEAGFIVGKYRYHAHEVLMESDLDPGKIVIQSGDAFYLLHGGYSCCSQEALHLKPIGLR